MHLFTCAHTCVCVCKFGMAYMWWWEENCISQESRTRVVRLNQHAPVLLIQLAAPWNTLFSAAKQTNKSTSQLCWETTENVHQFSCESTAVSENADSIALVGYRLVSKTSANKWLKLKNWKYKLLRAERGCACPEPQYPWSRSRAWSWGQPGYTAVT